MANRLETAMEAFRQAVHVKYKLGGDHPDGIPHEGTAERMCSKAWSSPKRLLTTPTGQLVDEILTEDRVWRTKNPPRTSVLRYC